MPLPDLVRVIIQNEKGEYLMVKDKYQGWNFPGGKIKKNEKVEDAGKREVLEETGLVIENLQIVNFYKFVNQNGTPYHCYYCKANAYLGGTHNKGERKEKNIRYKIC